jgi:hypothetical protein
MAIYRCLALEKRCIPGSESVELRSMDLALLQRFERELRTFAPEASYHWYVEPSRTHYGADAYDLPDR